MKGLSEKAEKYDFYKGLIIKSFWLFLREYIQVTAFWIESLKD